MMKPVACLGDSVFCAADTHIVSPLSPPVPFSVMGTIGPPCSIGVKALNIPIAREGDGGVHIACPGSNQFSISSGSLTVFDCSSGANKKVARVGDMTTHCGSPGTGYILTGCFTVLAED